MAAVTGCGTSSLTTVPAPAAAAVPLAPGVMILAQSSAPNPVLADRQRDRFLVLTTARRVTLPELYDQQRAFMLAHGWRVRHQPRLSGHEADPTIPGIRLAELTRGSISAGFDDEHVSVQDEPEIEQGTALADDVRIISALRGHRPVLFLTLQ
ncbi:MAG: hypothetical protein ACLP22_06995 [Solirubrobacteraceae bacterium]|jgi:hypothetical protein